MQITIIIIPLTALAVGGKYGEMIQKSSSSQVMFVLLKVIYSWEGMSTILHCPFSLFVI
ncbi:hypothetical protein DPMN_023477 [Dreissena polymorpha]|uniref:Uncharacterized protein n=1 Tax=Dreissena polymorpha TaxID=45954 RepID=A0A9D4LL75_DREPO|nr:hypothetical protein DPMN_023477 [Dreissena polymorpha]